MLCQDECQGFKARAEAAEAALATVEDWAGGMMLTLGLSNIPDRPRDSGGPELSLGEMLDRISADIGKPGAPASKRDEDAAGWRDTMKAATDALGELVTKAEAERDEARGALAKAEQTQRQIFASLEMAAALVRQLGAQLLVAHGEGQRPASIHLTAMAQLWLQAAARGELPSVPSLLNKS